MKPEVIVVRLSPAQWDIFNRSVVGDGGMQSLLTRLLSRADHAARRVTIRPQDLARVRNYAADYGDGGYQDRFGALLEAIDSFCTD